MAGCSDFLAQAALNFASGQQPFPAIGNRFLALFTTAPTSDAGTGGTEVSGTGYARVQVAGAITAAGAISTGAATITMPNVSGYPWIVPGMNVYDITNGKQIGTVLTYITTVLTLTANAANAGSGSTDSLQFSAWPAASASSGAEPATTPAQVTNSGAVISFAQAGTGGWGTALAWGIYDALTVGNLQMWDWLGAGKWSPFSCTLASPGVLTVTDQSFSSVTYAVVTSKFGGTLPTTGGSWAGPLTVAGVSGSTFNLGVNTTGTGDGMVRPIIEQSIPANVTSSFSTSQLTLSLA
jgi:hypothetical protein